MFNLNAFILETLHGMVGNYPDFQVREYALNWYRWGKLTETDLEELNAAIEAKNAPVEMPGEEAEAAV